MDTTHQQTAKIATTPRTLPSENEPRKSRGISFEIRMMLPALLLLAALSLFPFFYMIWMSFNDVSLFGGIAFRWTGLNNWGLMLGVPGVGQSWLITLIYFVATVGVEMLLGIAIALLVHEVVWGKNIALSLLLIPMFIAPVIVGLLGRFMVNPTYGLYSWVLKGTGLSNGSVFGSPVPAFIAIVLMDVWEWTPLITLITLAGLVSLPTQVIEAATVDGANYVQRLRRVVLPMISGIVIVALLIRSMDAIRYFDVVWLATNGGPADATKIIPIRLYDNAFRFFHLGYAAAIGLGMLVFSILVANLFLRVLRQRGMIA